MVWKCDLNQNMFLRFYFFVLLLSVSIEKIYQTLETVFHYISKHLEFRQKYSAARRIFNSLLSVWKCDETLSLVFDILLKNFLCFMPFCSCHALKTTRCKLSKSCASFVMLFGSISKPFFLKIFLSVLKGNFYGTVASLICT